MKNFTKKIVLENGTEFYGYGFGSNKESINEIVFNTSMVGYQELISDSSYAGQMVVMTYPLIGNYGITDEDYETKFPTIGGLIVKDYNDVPSNFRYTKTLSEVLEEHDIPSIYGVDTRYLTRMVRSEGSQKVLITSADTSKSEAMAKIEQYQYPTDMVQRVSCKKRWFARTPNHKYDIVAIDCGIKYNIIRIMNRKGCNVTIVPYNTSIEEILAFNPQGIFLSNGPGDPQDVTSVIELIKQLRGKVPIFGICLGMRFGHRGGNHPVKDLKTGKIHITSQNHSYAIDAESLKNTGLEITHVNLLDNTTEGIESKADKIFAVQYHPESAPGPQDSVYLFDRFIEMINNNT